MSYKTSTQGTYFSQFTNDEKIAYALNLSLAKVTTDAFKAGYEWYNSPDLFNAISKQSILSDSIPKYNEINNYYCVITVNGKEYITNKTVDNILTYQGGFKLSEILATNSEILNGSSNENSNPPTSSDFNSSGLCTKLPRQAFAYFVYWKNKLTGLGGTGNNANGTSGGLWPHSDDSLSLKLTLNGDGSNNADRTYSSVIANEDLMTKLQDYIPLKIINPSFISGTINQTDGIPENLKQYVNKKIAINVGVPTISTWNGLSNSNNSDNIAFFNPLLTKSLNEPYGYNGNGLGNGYWIRGTDSSRTNIRPDYGSSAVGEGTMIFSAMTGFILFFGVSNILTNSTGVSVKNPPCVTALRYTGETFSDGIISQGDTLPAVEVSNDKDLFINTTDNTIHRLEDNNGTKTWVGIGGGGGGDGDMEINGVLKIKNDSTQNEKSFSIVNANDEYRFLTMLVGGSSQLYMYDAAGNTPIALTSDYHSYFNVTDGNVGIGTNYPDGAKLTIGDYNNVASKTTGGIYDTLRLCVLTQQASTYHGLHWYNNNNNFMMSAIRSSVGGSYNNCSLHFYTSKDRNTPTQKMSIDGDGNVNISPGNLTVSGNTDIGNTNIGGTLTSTGDTTTFIGRVGIGTSGTNLYNKLYVYGGAYFKKGYFKVNDDKGADMFWIMNGKSYFKSTIKIDQSVKIGRDASLSPPDDGELAASFSHGDQQSVSLVAYYSLTRYLIWGAKEDNGFLRYYDKPLLLGGDSGNQLELNSSGATITGNLTVTGTVSASSGATITGNLTVTGTVSANGETLTGGGSNSPWETSSSNIYYNLGDIGIGTNSPSNTLTINGAYNDTVSILGLRGGNTATDFNNGAQIAFGFNGTDDYQHFIHTRHNSAGDPNAIDFYVCDGTQNNTVTSGSIHTMSLVSGKVGIGTTSPSRPFHVYKSGSQEPLALFQSANGDCSIRVEGPGGEVYVEIANTGSTGSSSSSWGIGTNDDNKLHFAYGSNSTMNKTDKMVIANNGYVGIGTTSPTHPLQVASSVYRADFGSNQATYWADNSSGTWNDDGNGTSNNPMSIKANQGILSMYGFWTHSDKRIKKDIVEIDDDLSLKKLRDISCCSYKYIDTLGRGNITQIGFIAQQVNEHLPNAISIQNIIIPNEMKKLENVSWNDTKMSSNDLQDVSGIKYRFYVSNDISDNEKMVELVGDENNCFTFEEKWENVFCYGKEVDDFHTLDKEKLFALNFSATQEIDRIQQQQLLDISGNKVDIELLKLENETLKTENNELANKINNLENQNANLLSRLEAIEKRLQDANI
jgi:hypothetical protein